MINDKMINFITEIPYYEFESSDFSTVKNNVDNNKKSDIRDCKYIREGKIEVSRFRLSLAIAKSLYSKVPDIKSLRQLAFSYFIQIPLLLKSSRKKLYIDYDNQELFRDFSKSCRDGEIAQGICYIMAKDVLHAVSVDDFKYYCYKRKHYFPKCTTKTPDYLLTMSDGSIALLEVKGIYGANPTQCMTYGMDQCNNGELYLQNFGNNPSKKYVSAVTFSSTKNRKRSTSIYYSDSPSDNNSITKGAEYIQGSIIREYAKFMYFAGDETLHKMIYDDQLQPEENINKYYEYFDKLSKNDNIRTLFSDGKKDHQAYKMIRISEMKYKPIFDNAEYKVEFGIAQQVLRDCSKSFNSKPVFDPVRSDIFKESFEGDEKIGEFEIFPDGTYMRVESVIK